jgi:hypothetical protein
MLLVALKFVHYAPKGSQEGILEYLLADTLESALEYIYKEYRIDGIDPNQTGHFFPNDDWWKSHPTKRQEAIDLGLTVDRIAAVDGPEDVFTKWFEGNDWQEPSDLHYGVTHYSWGERQEISAADAAVLSKLGIAKTVKS